MSLDLEMPRIMRAIRRRGMYDPAGLSDDLLVRIIGLAGVIQARIHAYIERRLRRADNPDVILPADLVREEWITRSEKIARFIAEMSTIRARINHVVSLGVDTPRRAAPISNRRGAGCVEPDPSPPGSGEACPAPDRIGGAASSFQFP